MNTSRTLVRRSGFTLTELVIAMAVFSLLSIGVAAFTIDSSRLIFRSTEKLEVNKDIRLFTSQMAVDAQGANSFRIYKSFALADRNSPFDRRGPGNAGDFVLFIYHQPYPTYKDTAHITRLVGYFRRKTEGDRGPVHRFDIEYASGAYKSVDIHTPEALIAHLQEAGDFRTVVELSRGLANDALFYNYNNQSVMIKAEIIHGNQNLEVSDTYNYCVSPRG